MPRRSTTQARARESKRANATPGRVPASKPRLPMEDFFTRVWTDLIGRVEGPMKFRLVLQPTMACILGIRAGLRDAREGKLPFLWALAFHPECRKDTLREAWKDTGKILVLAVILDVVYQVAQLRMVYPGEAIIVAFTLAAIPYSVLRPIVNRLARWRKAASRP
jgi:hypothetical protein